MSDKAPPILMQKTPKGWMPYGLHSADMLDDLVMWQVMKCEPRKGRTVPRNSAYFAGLQVSVKATEAWPTAHHMHQDVKSLCGYVEHYYNPLTGEATVRPQSTAFDKMSESEFAAFFRMAQKRVTEKLGFDPWERNEHS